MKMRGYSKNRRVVIKEHAPRGTAQTSSQQRRKLGLPKEWDSRFYLGKIPDYNAYEDRHCKAGNILSRHFRGSKTKGEAVLAPGGIRPIRRPPTMELHPHSVKSGNIVRNPRSRELLSRGPSQNIGKVQSIVNEETVTALKDEIGYLWEIYKVDQYYREAFLSAFSKIPAAFLVEYLAREIDALYKEKAIIQKLYLAIKKREELIVHITKMNEHVKASPLGTSVIENAVQLLENLRLATLSVVESGLRLRAELKKIPQSTTEKIDIVYNGQNYFEKIIADTKFINESAFGKLLRLGKKIDVFFMGASQPVPLLPSGQKSKSQVKQFAKRSTFQGEVLRKNSKSPALMLTIPIGGLYKRMKMAEAILAQEVLKIEPANNGYGEAKYGSNQEATKTKTASDIINMKVGRSNTNGVNFKREQEEESVVSKEKREGNFNAEDDFERLGSAASRPVETDPGSMQLQGFNRRGTGTATEPEYAIRDMKSDTEKVNSEVGTHEELVSEIISLPVKPVEEVIPEETIKTLEEASFKPLRLKESEAEHFLTRYLEKLPKNVKESYLSPQDIIRRTQNSPESYWLTLSDAPEETTLSIFCVELAYDRPRAVILHASTVVSEQFGLLLTKLKEYIWKNVNTNEIRVELKYIQEGDKFSPCESLKAIYCQNNGFRWKTLLNDSTKGYENRTLVLGVSRPADSAFVNPRKLDTTATSITLKHCSILSLDSKPDGAKEKMPDWKCPLYSTCSFIEALLCISQNEELTEIDESAGKIASMIKMAKTIARKGKLCATRGIVSEGTLDPIKSLLEGQKMHANNIPTEGEMIACGLQSVYINWFSSGLIEYNGYRYTRIKEGSFMASETPDYTIIVVRTSDPSIGAIIAIPKKSPEKLQTQAELWKELKAAMVNNSGKPVAYKEIWVPSFSMKCDFSSEINLTKGITEGKYIKNIKETGSFELYSPAPHEGGLVLDNFEQVLIINTDFLIGLVNEKVEEALGIPLALMVVSKDTWTLSEK